MFWNNLLYTFRKLKKYAYWHIFSIVLLSFGYSSLLHGFYIFQSGGGIDRLLLLTAAAFLLGGTLNHLNIRCRDQKEYSIRRLLGANDNEVYSLIFLESLLLSLSAMVLSFIILETRVFRIGLLAQGLHYSFMPSDMIFIIIVMLLVSIIGGLLYLFKLAQGDVAEHLGK